MLPSPDPNRGDSDSPTPASGSRTRAVARLVRAAPLVLLSGARRAVTRPSREILLTTISIGLVIAVFWLLDNQFLFEGIGYDESHFVWGGWCILKGLIPYRDFLEFKPPLTFLTHALALALHGYRDFQFRWFFLYFPLSSLIALYFALLSRGIDRVCLLALILGISQLWVNHQFHDSALSDPESIGLTFYFFGLACLLAKSRFGDKLKAVGAGLLVLCAQSKEPFLPTVFFTWIGCFLLDSERATLREDAKRYLKVTAAGAGVAVAALCLYLVPTGGMTHYFRMVAGYARIYRDPQHSYCVLAGRFQATTPLNDLWLQFQRARTEFLNVSTLGYLFPFVAIFLVFVPRRSVLLAVTGFFAVAAGVWSVTASNCQWMHYYNMPMAGLFFAAIVGLDSMRRRLTFPSVHRTVGWVLLPTVLVAVWPAIEREIDRKEPGFFANAYHEAVPGALKFIAEHTGPEDRILTTGSPALYVQANRRSALRESALVDPAIHFYPGNTDEERLSGLRAQLERNMPKVVTLDALYEDRRTTHYRVVFMPFLKEHGYKQAADRIWLRPD
jgi:hypothetical protein